MADQQHPAGQKQALLTPQQWAMSRARHRAEVSLLSPEQKKEFSKKLRHDVEKMSPSDLAAMRTGLQAEWDALPADRKEQIESRIAARKGE